MGCRNLLERTYAANVGNPSTRRLYFEARRESRPKKTYTNPSRRELQEEAESMAFPRISDFQRRGLRCHNSTDVMLLSHPSILLSQLRQNNTSRTSHLAFKRMSEMKRILCALLLKGGKRYCVGLVTLRAVTAIYHAQTFTSLVFISSCDTFEILKSECREPRLHSDYEDPDSGRSLECEPHAHTQSPLVPLRLAHRCLHPLLLGDLSSARLHRMRLPLVTAALSLAAVGIHHTTAQTCDDLEEALRSCRMEEEESPTPSSGFTCDGVLNGDGDVCCAAGCGECGGVGCSDRGGGLDKYDCCVSDIRIAGSLCSVTGEAPCLVDRGEQHSVLTSTGHMHALTVNQRRIARHVTGSLD